MRPGRNGSHAGVTQAFRGAKRASGDRRRAGLLAGTRQSQCGEKRRAGPIFARQKDTRRRIWCGFGGRQLERLKRFSQHGCIFLSVVAVPSFPQCKGAHSIIWNSGFAVRNDVFDGLAGTQFHATSKKLLCGNRSDTSLLILTTCLCCYEIFARGDYAYRDRERALATNSLIDSRELHRIVMEPTVEQVSTVDCHCWGSRTTTPKRNNL